jgi:hypothetical protein
MAYAREHGHRTSLLSIDGLEYDGHAAAWFWCDHETSDAQTSDGSTGGLMSHRGQAKSVKGQGLTLETVRGHWSIRRLCPVFRRPLLRKGRQRLFLAGHAFDGDGIDGDDIDAREEALGPLGLRLPIF